MSINFNSTTNQFYDVTGVDAEGYLNWAGVLKVMRLYSNTLLSSHATWAPPTGDRAGTEANTFASDLLEPIWTTIGPKTTDPRIRPSATFTRPGYTETSTTLPDEITQLLSIARARFDAMPWDMPRNPGTLGTGEQQNSGDSYNWQWPRRQVAGALTWTMPSDIAYAFALYASYLGMIRLNERGAWRTWATTQQVMWGERRRRFDLENDVEYAQGSSQQEREHLTTLLTGNTNTSVTLTGGNINTGDKVVVHDALIDIPYDVQKFLWNHMKPYNVRVATAIDIAEQASLRRIEVQLDEQLVQRATADSVQRGTFPPNRTAADGAPGNDREAKPTRFIPTK